MVLSTSRYALCPVHLAISHLVQITVAPELFDEMEKEWADPLDPVFHLSPPAFKKHATAIYDQIGRPDVTSDNFWEVYAGFLTAFRSLPDDPELAKTLQSVGEDEVVEIPLLPGLRPLDSGRLDGSGNRVVSDAVDDLDLREYAYFTPSEDESNM
jgi:hypothetical protein